MSVLAALASLFGAGAGLVGQSLTNDINARNNAANNATQIKLANQADARNLALWNATNRYNSPVEQRKRLEAAGLSAGLMYGGIENTAGVPADSNVPTTSAGQRQFNANSVTSAFNSAADIIDANTGINRQIKEQQLRSMTIDNNIKEDSAPEELRGKKLANDKLEQDISHGVQIMDHERQANKREQEKHDKWLIKVDEEIKKEQTTNSLLEKQLAAYDEDKRLERAAKKLSMALMQQQYAENEREAEQAAKEILAIEDDNYTMAQFAYFRDEIYPQLVKAAHSGKKHAFAYLPAPSIMLKKFLSNDKIANMSPEEMWSICTPRVRDELLDGSVRKKGHMNSGKGYKPTYSTFYQYYEATPKYQNLYYRSCDTNGLKKATNTYFQDKSSGHLKVGYGPVSADISM